MRVGHARISIELLADHKFGGFTAHVPNIPVHGEGETEEEALADLSNSLVGYIEAFGLMETLSHVQLSIDVDDRTLGA